LRAPEDDTPSGIYQAVAQQITRRGYTQEIYQEVAEKISHNIAFSIKMSITSF
jgi:hypothetical protein